MKPLTTVVAIVGAVFLYATETNFPPHSTLTHRAIPAVVYLAVVLVLAAVAKARENAKSNRSSSQGGSAYRASRGYQSIRRDR